jgi:hypothetical protein
LLAAPEGRKPDISEALGGKTSRTVKISRIKRRADGGITPEQAVDEAIARIKQTLSK